MSCHISSLSVLCYCHSMISLGKILSQMTCVRNVIWWGSYYCPSKMLQNRSCFMFAEPLCVEINSVDCCWPCGIFHRNLFGVSFVCHALLGWCFCYAELSFTVVPLTWLVPPNDAKCFGCFPHLFPPFSFWWLYRLDVRAFSLEWCDVGTLMTDIFRDNFSWPIRWYG
jgi:hypothetical protein